MKLAKQNSAMFFEVSAADGRNIDSAITEMAALLKQNFDNDLVDENMFIYSVLSIKPIIF